MRHDTMNRYIVILPAYNEGKFITSVINGIKEYEKDADILVVNDGSRDSTAEISEGLGAIVISHPFNIGYAAALQTGYRYAMSRGYDYIVIMDSDGQHDPGSISTLFKTLETTGADVVIGSRFIESGYRMEFSRRIGKWVFSKIARLYIGQRITDPTSGFQLLNRQAFTFLASEKDYPLDYPDVNILMLLHKKRFKIAEAPVRMVNNQQGDSMHSGLRPVMYVIRMFLAIALVLLRKED